MKTIWLHTNCTKSRKMLHRGTPQNISCVFALNSCDTNKKSNTSGIICMFYDGLSKHAIISLWCKVLTCYRCYCTKQTISVVCYRIVSLNPLLLILVLILVLLVLPFLLILILIVLLLVLLVLLLLLSSSYSSWFSSFGSLSS